jgi:AraC-like DNA-binding protein
VLWLNRREVGVPCEDWLAHLRTAAQRGVMHCNDQSQTLSSAKHRTGGACGGRSCAQRSNEENPDAAKSDQNVSVSTAISCVDFLLLRADAGAARNGHSDDMVEPSPSKHPPGNSCGTVSLRAAKGSAFTSICLPQQGLLCVAPTARDKLSAALEGSPAIRQAITGYLSLLSNAGEALESKGQHRLALHTLDTVGLLLNESAQLDAPASSDPGMARMSRIERDIVENLTDPDLSIGAVAARLGTHSKQVQRLFAASGRTFADFVLEERLQLARRKIVDVYGAPEKISTIAFDVGFGDLAYFNRAFRARFGQTPSEYRSMSAVA